VKGESKVGKQSGHFKWLKTSTVSTTTFNQTNLIEYFPWFSLFAVSLVWEWKRHVSVAHSIFDISMVAMLKQHIIYLTFRSSDSEIRTMLACVVYVGCQNALDSTYLGGTLELFWLEVRPAYLSCVKNCCISSFVSPFMYNESFENQPLLTQTTQREAILLRQSARVRLHDASIMRCLWVIIISYHYCACSN